MVSNRKSNSYKNRGRRTFLYGLSPFRLSGKPKYPLVQVVPGSFSKKGSGKFDAMVFIFCLHMTVSISHVYSIS